MPTPATSSPAWRRALVTGGSSGIGRSFAAALAAAGTDLVLVARRREPLDELAGELRHAHRCDVEVLVADLTDDAGLADVEARLADTTHPVDLLVNNAGFGSHGSFVELPVADQDELIRLNVLAAVRLAHAALPGMLDRRRGGILNVSSLAGLQPLPNWTVYAATKAFLTSFSEALHEEVRARGVVVLALKPGMTRTAFHQRSGLPPVVIPRLFWMEADDVVASALKALSRGRASHVPGVVNKAVATLSRLSPRIASRRVIARAGRS